MKFFVISIIFIFSAGLAKADGQNETSNAHWARDLSYFEKREVLMNDLFWGYKKDVYPGNSTVQLGIVLQRVDLDEENDLMISDLWQRIVWYDSRLRWDEKEYGVDVLRVPQELVWKPDTLLYNGPQVNYQCLEVNVLLYPNGESLWMPACRIESYCNITLSCDPFKEQECLLKFGSLTFDGLTMGLELYSNHPSADVSEYFGGKYKVTKNEVEREVTFYDCCKEPYVSLKYTLGLTRAPTLEYCKTKL